MKTVDQKTVWKNVIEKISIIFYAIVVIAFVIFFICIGANEGNTIYEKYPGAKTKTITDYTVEEIIDDSAPTGMRQKYVWTLEDEPQYNENLIFYTVHQYVDVYINGELVYSLHSDEGNRVAHSVSSNWITVPVHPFGSGQTISVVITPVYKSAQKRVPEFLIGTRYDVFSKQIKKDAAEMILSILCIVVGIFILGVECYMRLRKSKSSSGIAFIGNFSILLGIWRITDTRSAALFFPQSTMLLGYITIGVLCLLSVPLLLSIKKQFEGTFDVPLVVTSIFASAIALSVLICQLSGFAEFKETLTLTLVLLIVSGVAVLTAIVFFIIKNKEKRKVIKNLVIYSVLLVTGVLADFIMFFVKGNSAGLMFVMISFLICAVILMVKSIIETGKIAYTDIQTGLINRARWDELMSRNTTNIKDIGLMMLDLNQLKKINDSVGHHAGDILIFNFANILRNTLPKNSVICRWGGDEFTIMLLGTSSENIEQYLNDLHKAADEYNAGENYKIHFAGGYALSNDYPDLTLWELLKKADQMMYANKSEWYSENT